MFKRRITFLLAVFIIVSGILAGCQKQNPENDSSEPRIEMAVTESNKDWFVFRTVVESPFYEKAYSEAHMQTFRNMMDAFLSYKNEFDIAEGVEWWEVGEFSSYLFPPFGVLVQDVTQKGSKGYIVYQNDEETTGKQIQEFEKKVEWWINSCTEQDDPDMLKAMKIYQKMSKEVTYDYEALAEDSVKDVSPYRALMESSGICQSFAPAYSYLLMQIGIDACPAGGLSSDNSTAHEWTLLKLCDKWFFADVTFENTDGGNRLFYFGMTAKRRSEEGDYPIKVMNLGECNRVWGNDMKINDDRFDCLTEIYEVRKFSYDSENIIVDGLDLNNQMMSVKIKYR